MPQGAYPPGYYQAPGYAGAPMRRRTGWLTFAQVTVIIEACFFVLGGIAAIAVGVFVSSHGGSVNGAFSDVNGFTPLATDISSGVIIAAGVAILVIALIWLVLGVTLGRPSNVSRWIILVFVILALIGEISSLANRIAGGAVIAPIVLIAINALILYALLLDPGTRRVFSGRAY